MSIKKTFSKDFLWGAATAAHQVEGNNHNQWTEWELKTAEQKARTALERFQSFPIFDSIKDQATSAYNYISGRLMDHYNTYEQDFQLLTDLNMNAYRFSVEWSRIEPNEGEWNDEAIHHYREYIASLKKRGIEPIITLFHFTLPIWFSDRGGFEKRTNSAYFVRFAKKIMTEIGQDITYVITINEPEVYTQEGYLDVHFPPQTKSTFKAWRVFRNLATAHNQVYEELHKINPRYNISIAKNSAYYFAGDKRRITTLFVKLKYYIRDDYFLKKVVKRCDFLGVNYYFSNRVVGSKVKNLNEKVHDLGWNVSPVDIEHVLVRLNNKYHLPILITENGIADQADILRKWWLEETIKGMHNAATRNVRLLGYIHWSLMDNFEWGFGRIPRFGLASVDYATNTRTLRPSAIWFGTFIESIRAENSEQA